jgi:hypothetical protein
VDGKRVDVLYQGYQDQGDYRLTYSSENRASGVYILGILQDGKVLKTTKMVYLK